MGVLNEKRCKISRDTLVVDAIKQAIELEIYNSINMPFIITINNYAS
jgi:hypothetical protein